MSIDSSDMRSFATDLGRASSRTAADVRRVVTTSANAVRKTMRSDMRKSRSFGVLADAIDREVSVTETAIEAEVGVRRRSGARANLGFGANIAYFGSSRGGGTVRDPQAALDEEIPTLEKALSDAIGGAL